MMIAAVISCDSLNRVAFQVECSCEYGTHMTQGSLNLEVPVLILSTCRLNYSASLLSGFEAT